MPWIMQKNLSLILFYFLNKINTKCSVKRVSKTLCQDAWHPKQDRKYFSHFCAVHPTTGFWSLRVLQVLKFHINRSNLSPASFIQANIFFFNDQCSTCKTYFFIWLPSLSRSSWQHRDSAVAARTELLCGGSSASRSRTEPQPPRCRADS